MRPMESSGKADFDPSYPAGGSYAELLEWHLDTGTRPGGRSGRVSRPWNAKEFASSVGVDERSVRNWRNGRSRPADGLAVERASQPECSVKTVVQYVYVSTSSGTFVPLTNTASLPSDVASTTTLAGVTVPYVVRVEIGTIDRSIYQIAILNDPTTQPNPTVNDPPKGWNKKLIWSHGGGCPPG
jgi:hypothetical protein